MSDSIEDCKAMIAEQWCPKCKEPMENLVCCFCDYAPEDKKPTHESRPVSRSDGFYFNLGVDAIRKIPNDCPPPPW